MQKYSNNIYLLQQRYPGWLQWDYVASAFPECPSTPQIYRYIYLQRLLTQHTCCYRTSSDIRVFSFARGQWHTSQIGIAIKINQKYIYNNSRMQVQM